MYRDRRRVALIALGAVALSATGVWSAVEDPEWWTWPATLLFGAGAVLLVAMSLRKGPVLRIDMTGLRDLRSGLHVRWEEVTAVRLWEQFVGFQSIPYLLLDVRDREAALSGVRRRLFRFGYRSSSLYGIAGILVTLQDVRGREWILDVVRRFYQGPVED